MIKVIFWLVALLISAFWGIYGINHEWNYDQSGKLKAQKDRKCFCGSFMEDRIEASGILLSEFIGSLAGWVCFYALLDRSKTTALGAFDIFLGTVAVVGMSGFSYRIVEALKK